jgi:hypothetical protein
VAIVLIADRVRVALQTYDGRQDIDVLSIPWRQLVVFVVLAAIVGVLAAVLAPCSPPAAPPSSMC